MNGAGITIVGASAGSGKTYRLTQEVTAAVGAGASPRVDVSGLVAVTFTRKAHAELEARIRQRLVEDGAYDEALRLPLAYIGTVHATALHLLQEFAVDAGLSPNVDVVVGNETKLLRQALERTLDAEARAHLDELAARIELRMDMHRRTDWVTPVADIMDLARSNRIAPDELAPMAARSIDGLLDLLPPPAEDGAALERALEGALAPAIAALTKAGDGRKNTEKALGELKDAKRALEDGELRWSSWVKLSTVAPAKALDHCVSDVRAAASRYLEHPRLHDDLRAMTQAIFAAARAGLAAYQAWKKERRVVDYVDMLDGALDLVEHPRVRAELAKRLRFVVVDEFQDTSPIQLALFVRLHALAGRSVWVGDRKQCIFEYAGADPILMDAVTAWVTREGGAPDRLCENYRSRPELVRACSELFATAFARHGFVRDEVVVNPRRPELDGLAKLPPFSTWVLETSSKPEDAEAIAEGVWRMLDAPSETPVLDRTTKMVRDVRAGDVAILVATNEAAGQVAAALHARGIRASLARAGLFMTPEGTLLVAALRWLLDGGDGLSAATLDALTGWDGRSPDEWLAGRIYEVAHNASNGARGERRAGSDADAETATRTGWRGVLSKLRAGLAELSPTEALDATLAALDMAQLAARWPDPVQRVANLDALRAAAADYEGRCAQEREAATVAGMLRYFDDLQSEVVEHDELLASDDQHVPADDGAVTVCTYHKSKGLEWPVVVLADLAREERRDAFEVSPEPVDGGFDPERPLAGRTIRYWPWPFGALKKAPLREAAERSAEGRRVSEREDRERVRLLYVGFTRARDHLVLAVRVNRRGETRCAWLDVLCDESGAPLVELPVASTDRAVADVGIGVAEGEPLRVPARVFRLGPERPERPTATRAAVWFERPAGEARDDAADAAEVSDAAKVRDAVRPAYRIAPSLSVDDWPEVAGLAARSRIGVIERLESAIALGAGSYEDDVLGNVVHGFLAADVEGLSSQVRHTRATRLIAGAALGAIVTPEVLLTAGDVLRAWIEKRWRGGAIWHREIPIEAHIPTEHGERRVSGIVDLLLETDDGYVLVDHKTFPARAESAWRAKCKTFIPQLAAYTWLLNAMGGKRVKACWVHLPVGGAMVEVVMGGGR